MLLSETPTTTFPFEDVVIEIMAKIRTASTEANHGVADATKALARAVGNKDRCDFSIGQLMEEKNIFSALSHLGEKEEANEICDTLGIAVPAAKSSVWHTSVKDAKKKDA